MENDDILGQIDWDNLEGLLLDNGGEIDGIFHQGGAHSAADSFSCRIGEIESHLMREDGPGDLQLDDDFLAQFFVDSPPPPPADAASSVAADHDISHSSSSSLSPDSSSDKDNIAAGSPQPPHLTLEDETAHPPPPPNDPISKKQRRQLRNRDAAVRSRERKKEYVKDLEMKSKYLEWECRRLGQLLQCCVAENQALRFSLQNGSGAAACGVTSAKQESAVLLLESLLLGSLLWLLGIMCLFALPTVAQLSVPVEQPTRANQKEEKTSDMATPYLGVPAPPVRGMRRCKASRTRMKLRYLYSSHVFCTSSCFS